MTFPLSSVAFIACSISLTITACNVGWSLNCDAAVTPNSVEQRKQICWISRISGQSLSLFIGVFQKVTKRKKLFSRKFYEGH